ncbi:unnamed protein product [Coffea canephora]|uniref:Uncharacterized protein n=1 Tax=Coffea canephora TaxID=49390 RepID=A0A068TRZ1_COFCA|nr:unnamed protein product [Coffea canephora]
MPKDRRVNRLSSSQSRVSPYNRGSRDLNSNKLDASLPPSLDESEWEEARCPICMEHPHNAVLLICSSREKGCCPYMCDTSHRHSNCLDQYRKSSIPTADSTARPDDEFLTWMLYRNGGGNGGGRQTSLQPNSSLGVQALEHTCPLCRGQISGWIVIEAARKYMNAKVRSCSMESCDFIGNYDELRKHARCKHPSVRPSEADPQRQSDWARLERQRDLGDTLSAYQSRFGSDLDGDDPPGWYDLNQDDDPFEGHWSAGVFFDDFFSGIHSESEDEESVYGDTLIDLHSEVEFSFSFLNDLSFYPWDEGRSSGSARTGSSLLNRSTRSRSSPDYHPETLNRNWNESAPSRYTQNSSRPTAPSGHSGNSSRPIARSRDMPSSSGPTAPSRHTSSSWRPTVPSFLRPSVPSRHIGNSLPANVPSTHSPSSLQPARDAPNSSRATAPSRHESSTSRPTAPSAEQRRQSYERRH